jgi:hypothetical protein
VTLAYKRAEVAIVPTGKAVARKDESDAFSALTVFSFFSQWWGDTRVTSFITTGFAAQNAAKAHQENGVEKILTNQ